MRRVAVVVISSLVALASVEAALRIANRGYGNEPLLPDAVLHHAHPRNYQFLNYDPASEYGGHLVRYDADGVTVDPSGAARAASSRYRIAIMGDSFAEATQVSYTRTFAGILAAGSAGRAEVRNFGVSSYSPLLYYLQWNMQVQAFHPTHVFVLLYSNDVTDDETYMALATRGPNGMPVAVPGPQFARVTRCFRSLYAARLTSLSYLRASFWLKNRRAPQTGGVGEYIEENREITPLTDAMLTALVQAIRRSGAEVLLSAVPSKLRLLNPSSAPPDPQFSDRCREWATAKGIPFVDLVPAFARAQAEGRPMFFLRDIHWTEQGHAVAGDALCRAIGTAICR